MNLYLVSIFPDIYSWFLETSLVKRASENWILHFEVFNPRDFTKNKHKQVDDVIYWWWDWLLLMADPIIATIDHIIHKYIKDNECKIIYLAPWKKMFDQKVAWEHSNLENVILLSWRYEWIDARVEQYYGDKLCKLSIWKYVLMWWEVASMVWIEAVTRLISWVVKEKWSVVNESYNIKWDPNSIEYPQYSRPKETKWLKVPDVLLGWNHKKIEKWRMENTYMTYLNK